MDIVFKNKRLAKDFNAKARLEKIHGVKRAKKIKLRMAEFRAALSLMDFWPPKSGPSRCHELKGRKYELSVDLDHPYRLIFTPAHNPVPLKDDGGLDWSKITAIKILRIEDTHE